MRTISSACGFHPGAPSPRRRLRRRRPLPRWGRGNSPHGGTRWIIRAALAAALAGAPSARAAAGDTLTRGPYVMDASSVSARICWRLGALPSGSDCGLWEDLAPGATFAYKVPGSDRVWTGRSLPPAGGSLRFAAFGDSGTGLTSQHSVARAVEGWDPELVLHVGDIVYPKGEDKHYDERYFQPYARLVSRIPFFPAVGNHDYGRRIKFLGFFKDAAAHFRENYFRIHGRPPYYSFDAGGVHFVSLDTNHEGWGVRAAAPVEEGSPQLAWLERDLAASKARWKIVFTHVPLYSTGRHGGKEALRRTLEPVFRRHGVALVIQGHDHSYERSRPIGGVVYVTVGTGGAKLHGRKDTAEWSEVFLADYGFLAVTAGRDALTLEFFDEHGKVRDHARIERR